MKQEIQYEPEIGYAVEIKYKNIKGCVSQRVLDVTCIYGKNGYMQQVNVRTFIDTKGKTRCFSDQQYTTSQITRVSQLYPLIVDDLQEYSRIHPDCIDLIHHTILGLENMLEPEVVPERA